LDLYSGEHEGEILLSMLSGSMAGALLPGDILTVRSLGKEKVHVGDIVVFREGGKLVAHRLIFVFRLLSFSLFVEKGDANPMASILRPSSIVGRVSAARRQGKMILIGKSDIRWRARCLAARTCLWHLVFELPKNFLKRILSRDARV
jgi:signal peptidase I